MLSVWVLVVAAVLLPSGVPGVLFVIEVFTGPPGVEEPLSAPPVPVLFVVVVSSPGVRVLPAVGAPEDVSD